MKADPLYFLAVLNADGLPLPLREHRFHPTRKWRFDYAWPDHKVALEVEGAIWTGGRHTRGAGYAKDCEKYSEAAALGWRIIRCQPKELYSARTLNWLRRAMNISTHPGPAVTKRVNACPQATTDGKNAPAGAGGL